MPGHSGGLPLSLALLLALFFPSSCCALRCPVCPAAPEPLRHLPHLRTTWSWLLSQREPRSKPHDWGARTTDVRLTALGLGQRPPARSGEGRCLLCRWTPSRCALTWQRGGSSLSGLFLRGHRSRQTGGSTPMAHHPSEATPPNTVTLGARLPLTNFRGHRHSGHSAVSYLLSVRHVSPHVRLANALVRVLTPLVA